MKNKNQKQLKIKNNSLWSRPKIITPVITVAFIGAFAAMQIFAATTSMTLLPSSNNVDVGANVSVAIRVNSSTDQINAVQANISFDPTKLQYVDTNETGSSFGTKAETTPGSGTLRVARALNGGEAPLTGDNLVTTVNFRSLSAGSTSILIASDSIVAKSSDSTNTLSVRTGTTLNIADSSTPSVPISLNSSSTNLTSISLGWVASSDNVGVTSYIVYRNNVQIGTSATTTYTDNGLNAGTSYSYTVAARDAAGNTSGKSAVFTGSTLSDTMAPTVPGNATSAVQTMTSISLNWTASTDNLGVIGYRVYRNGALVGSPGTTNYTDSGLQLDTAYSYTVAAYDVAGNTSSQTIASSFRTLSDTQAPSVPTALSGIVSNRDAVLNWTASTDNVAVSQYLIYVDGVQVGTSPTVTYRVVNAPKGLHSYSVAASDAKGNVSTKSTAVSVNMLVVADINGDSVVNVLDLSIILSNWNKTGVNASDINGDSVVNVLDLSVLLSNWTG